MFEYLSETRYMTRGISETLPIEVQLAIWNSIDSNIALGVKMDYLQVFKFSQEGSMLKITHTQEQPKHTTIVYMDYRQEYKDLLTQTIFVIDDVDHSTILYSHEY